MFNSASMAQILVLGQFNSLFLRKHLSSLATLFLLTCQQQLKPIFLHYTKREIVLILIVEHVGQNMLFGAPAI